MPLIFNSCKKEDEEPTNTGNNNTNNTGNTTATILGEWDLKYIEYETTTINQGSDNGTESGTIIIANGEDIPFLYLEFYEDQQVKATTWGEIQLDNGNYTDGTVIKYGTWEIDFGDDLYITIPNMFDFDDLGRPIKIDLLDNSRLQFTEQMYLYNGDQQGEGKYFFER